MSFPCLNLLNQFLFKKKKEARASERRARTVIYHSLLVLSPASKRKDTYKWNLRNTHHHSLANCAILSGCYLYPENVTKCIFTDDLCFGITLKLPCISEGDMDSWEGAPWPLAPPALPAFWAIHSLKQCRELTPPLQTLQAIYPRSLVLARPLASVLANFTSEDGCLDPAVGADLGGFIFPPPQLQSRTVNCLQHCRTSSVASRSRGGCPDPQGHAAPWLTDGITCSP